MADTAFGPTRAIPPAEVEDVDLYHAKTWVTKYVFSQDAKVIAIQYAVTATAIGLVALVLSWLMRLQLGFPGRVAVIDPGHYLQFITMHGMIMVVYLLTALFLGGFGNYLIPLMVGARDMVFPYLNMLSYWIYLLAVLALQLQSTLISDFLGHYDSEIVDGGWIDRDDVGAVGVVVAGGQGSDPAV